MSNILEVTIATPDELPALAKSVLQFATGEKLFALYAPMGAGKTTLIKELCRQLGSDDNFSSPTYSIANEYKSLNAEKIFHLDLYRLKNLEDAYNIGIDEYISGSHYCFIEWPEVIGDLLPPDTVKIKIKQDGDVRYVTVTK